jgi:arsenite-transporting ATPase
VVKESMRTFTYLNLYGYLTDAVVVNRVLPEEAAEGYFAPWHEAQCEQMELVRSAFAPLPVLVSPHLEREVAGSEMLDRLGEELFPRARARARGRENGRAAAASVSRAEEEPWAILHTSISRELFSENGTATLRLPLPGADKADIDLKKVGLEVIVRVGPHKRTIILPATMAAHRPRAASFEDGTLEVRFERDAEGVGAGAEA